MADKAGNTTALCYFAKMIQMEGFNQYVFIVKVGRESTMAPSSSTLEKTGIKIETNPSDITALSPCAEELRQLLLNFTEIVPHSQV